MSNGKSLANFPVLIAFLFLAPAHFKQSLHFTCEETEVQREKELSPKWAGSVLFLLSKAEKSLWEVTNESQNTNQFYCRQTNVLNMTLSFHISHPPLP